MIALGPLECYVLSDDGICDETRYVHAHDIHLLELFVFLTICFLLAGIQDCIMLLLQANGFTLCVVPPPLNKSTSSEELDASYDS